MSPLSRFSLSFGLVLFLSSLGCKRKEENQAQVPVTTSNTVAEEASPPARLTEASTEEALYARYQWNHKTLVEAYDRAGSRNPNWDEDAREALEAFALLRSPGVSHSNRVASVQAVWDRVNAAIQNGCDDPMVRYLYVRDHISQMAPKDETGRELREAADKLNQSGYAPIRKFYGCLRAIEKTPYRNEALRETRHRLVRSGWKELEALARDPDVPPEEIYEVCAGWIDHVGTGNNERFFIEHILNPITRNWRGALAAELVKAKFYVQYRLDRTGQWDGRHRPGRGMETVLGTVESGGKDPGTCLGRVPRRFSHSAPHAHCRPGPAI